ncbi:hypothetical protein FRC09_020579 [Ceratobasidium sp. 395]|nr:hypothetical protein FRC09_020579 [Ceratobasidium sp. 395]
MESRPYNAYFLIVPNPRESNGIKRYGTFEEGDNRGQYMYWIKFGDSGDVETRTAKYKNPSQLIGKVHITNAPNQKPGKCVEKAVLDGYGDTNTEWHALCARALLLGPQELTDKRWKGI